MTRRVVVTGLGVLSPLGRNLKESWENLIAGRCGIRKLGEGYENLPCRVAATIKSENRDFDLNALFPKSELRTMAPGTAYALVASDEALKDAGWLPQAVEAKRRTGVSIGIGMVDLTDVCDTNEALKRSYNRVSPYFVPRILPNMAAGQVSIKYGFQGPNHGVSTACATGVHAIGDGFRFIRNGDADVMVCGGAEACISPLSIAAFCRMRALCTTFNDTPEKASRPFDRDRDGFVMGEGAAILILEELKHAEDRKTHIYGEILGYGLSGDAAHLTAPNPDGSGAFLAMQRALQEAGIEPKDVGYINAHATSTPLGDAIEVKAIKILFGDHCSDLAVSSTKGAHGHLLGAAGNLESIFALLACESGMLPPTINLDSVDETMDLNFVANKKQEWKSTRRRVALKNAFGFGGTNASLCIAQI